MKKTKLITVLALMCCMGALFFSTAAYASEVSVTAVTSATAAPSSDAKPLTVNAVTLQGNTLHVTVADANTGIDQTLDLNFHPYLIVLALKFLQTMMVHFAYH